MAMSPRLLRPRATGFNPKSISGLLAWYDASDSSTITVGTGVSAWADKSGNGYTLRQSTANNQPVTGTRTIGGKNALDFDGTNDVLSLGLTPPEYILDLATSRAITIFAVTGSDAPNSVSRLISMQRTGKNANDSGLFLGRHTTGSGTVELAVGGGDSSTNDQVDRNYLPGFVDTSTAAGIYAASISAAGNTATIHKNGTNQSLTSRYGTMLPSGWLGFGTGNHMLDVGSSRSAAGVDAAYWNGVVGEVLIYTRAVSVVERTAATRYLGKKWGITVA